MSANAALGITFAEQSNIERRDGPCSFQDLLIATFLVVLSKRNNNAGTE